MYEQVTFKVRSKDTITPIPQKQDLNVIWSNAMVDDMFLWAAHVCCDKLSPFQ